VAGRVALGFVIDRLDQRRVTSVSLISQAAALLLLLSTSEPALLYLACASFGASVGNLITLPALIIQREYPSGSFGMLTALVVAISQVSYSFGPGLLGVLRDAAGDYRAALVVCIVMQLVGAALILVRGSRP
jgi:predicted MFS family arabinose efflux permease